MKNLPYHWFAAALLGFALASCSGAPKEKTASQEGATQESAKPAEPAPIARGEAAAVQVSFSVESVDAANRVIKLKGPRGNEGEYEVGDQVKRLAEIKAGDKITAQYKVAATAELREPTEEEKSSPLVIVKGVDRGPADEPPSGGIGRAVRAVATIEQLDAPNQSFTVKGPLDGLVTVHVDDATAFSHLQVGQPLVVKFAESLVLSVQPASK